MQPSFPPVLTSFVEGNLSDGREREGGGEGGGKREMGII